MSSAAFHPRLRLVGAPDHSDATSAQDPLDPALLAVMKENRIAAHAPAIGPGFQQDIDTSDPRWILAMQTRSRLQGSILTPGKRDELMKSGRNLGLRPFEANLVIAVVQDQARSKPSSDGRRMSLPEESLKKPSRPAADVVWPKWLAAFAAAAAIVAVCIRWLVQ